MGAENGRIRTRLALLPAQKTHSEQSTASAANYRDPARMEAVISVVGDDPETADFFGPVTNKICFTHLLQIEAVQGFWGICR